MTVMNEVDGNLFDSECQTLVCPVNCKGVMGKGLALAFQRRFPDLLNDYRHACQTGLLTVSQPWLWKPEQGPWVLCLATKDDWRYPSRLDWLDAGLRYTVNHLADNGITSLAVPALGCGEGGLNWRDVAHLLYHYFDPVDTEVVLYRPTDKPWYQYPHW